MDFQIFLNNKKYVDKEIKQPYCLCGEGFNGLDRRRNQPRVCVSALSPVWLFAAPWTVALQAPLSMEFSGQAYCSGLPFPPPGDLPNPGIKTVSLVPPALAGRLFTTVPPGSPRTSHNIPISQNLGERGSISFQVYES